MTIDFSTKNPASCFIELSPELDDKNAWTGGLVLNILPKKGHWEFHCKYKYTVDFFEKLSKLSIQDLNARI